MLQEQYFSSYINSSLTHQSWTLIESKSSENNSPRAAIYVNKTILSAHSYELVSVSILDVMIIIIQLDQKQHLTLLINIYNTKKSTQLTELRTEILTQLRKNTYNGILIAGDFNLHHSLWNSSNYHSHDSEADTLIDIMTQLKLKLMLSAGIITFSRAKTIINLIWGNTYVEQRLIKCRIVKISDHGSDHHSIKTILNLKSCSYGPEAQRSYNYRKTDWKTFKEKLADYLSMLNLCAELTPKTVNKLTIDISAVIRRAIEEITPRVNICFFSKRWWNKNLKDLRKQAERTRRKYSKHHRQSDEKCWKKARREYYRKIKNCKRDTWQKYVSEANEQSIWKVNDYLSSLLINTYILTLKTQQQSMSRKRKH